MNVGDLNLIAERIRSQVGKLVVGQSEAIDLLLVSLFSGGHMLLEGPPGTAKTLLAQCFAASVGLQFGRIQFTPDLLPGDIIGINQFNFQTGTFVAIRGPIFCELLLADEINRTPPKTQAALLEAMQERRVTMDGVPQALSDRFMVIATENPIEQQGTYPLPEAQLDRFLFKHVLTYPAETDELALVQAQGATVRMPDPAAAGIEAVLDRAQLSECVELVSSARLMESVAAYIVSLVRATRASPDLSFGASPRSGAMLAAASRARAVLDGRDYVIPDDVKVLLVPLLRHRLILSPAAEVDGRRVDDVIRSVVEQIEAPR